jgi:hypothetical protein
VVACGQRFRDIERPPLPWSGSLRQRGVHATGGPPTVPTEEDRLLAAFLLVTTMAWRLFKPIGLTSAGLDPAPDPERDEKVTEWLRQLATVIAKR